MDFFVEKLPSKLQHIRIDIKIIQKSSISDLIYKKVLIGKHWHRNEKLVSRRRECQIAAIKNWCTMKTYVPRQKTPNKEMDSKHQKKLNFLRFSRGENQRTFFCSQAKRDGLKNIDLVHCLYKQKVLSGCLSVFWKILTYSLTNSAEKTSSFSICSQKKPIEKLITAWKTGFWSNSVFCKGCSLLKYMEELGARTKRLKLTECFEKP